MGTIHYKPLDPSKREIRLIELFPRVKNTSMQSEEPPRCNLIQASLDDKPDYAALSYTWGDAHDTKIVTVGDISVSVTRSLYSALEHLRYDKAVRIIWIDALCINQSDNDEKSWQVQLMRDIYQHATFVTIWLGPADSTSDEVMDFLSELGKEAMKFGLDGGPDLIRQVSAQWKVLASNPSSFRGASKQRVTVDSDSNIPVIEFLMGDLNRLFYRISGSKGQGSLFPIEGMTSLFKRPWWGRIWVLQEISLAQKAGFVCGNKRLSRRRCKAALNAFQALRFVFQETGILGGSEPTAYQHEVGTADFDRRPTVLLSMWETHKYSAIPLLALLRSTCISGPDTSHEDFVLEATDPRDKIYGLLGLAADRDELKELGVFPNYTLLCQDVYIFVAVAMLKQGHLSILSLANFSDTQIGLPSWVPDWSKPVRHSLQGTDTDNMTLEPEYNASGSRLQREPVFSGTRAKMSLLVSGIIYDKIYSVGATLTDFCSPNHTTQAPFIAAKSLLDELVRLSFLQDKQFESLKDRIRGVARTAIAETGYMDRGRWARIGNERFCIALSLIMSCVDSPCKAKLLKAELLDLMKGEGIQPEIDKVGAFEYCGEIYANASKRKPFVTAKGHLGLGLDTNKPGDVIAILDGTQVPFVLRNSADGKYKLVGEAYVDGIMDGEAVAGRESDGIIELI